MATHYYRSPPTFEFDNALYPRAPPLLNLRTQYFEFSHHFHIDDDGDHGRQSDRRFRCDAMRSFTPAQACTRSPSHGAHRKYPPIHTWLTSTRTIRVTQHMSLFSLGRHRFPRLGHDFQTETHSSASDKRRSDSASGAHVCIEFRMLDTNRPVHRPWCGCHSS